MHLVPPAPLLTGRWQRSLLVTTAGLRDTTSEVTWLQAGELYVDLRLSPQPLPAVGCLRELTLAQVQILGAVGGFAGRLGSDDRWAVWERLIDLQPPTGEVDQGSLVLTDDLLVETGRDAGYVEHWHRSAGPDSPVAALVLQDLGTGALAVAVRVGDHVGWARGRTPGLGQPVSLRDRQDHLDTEVAFGRADATGVVLTSSNHPWRGGSRLDLTADGAHVTAGDVAPDGTPVQRTWQILDGEGDFPLAAASGLVDVYENATST